MAFKYEVEEKKMEIKLYGKTYTLRFPTWGELEKWDEELLEKKTVAEITAHQRSQLVSLGLPEDVAKSIQSIDIRPLIKFVQDPEGTNSKKD